MGLPLAGVLLAAAIAGCVPGHYPGGNLRSRDSYTYESTVHIPQTVELVDTRNGQTVWSKDVPVGQQLVIRFYQNDEESSVEAPDRMRWELMDAGTRFGKLDNFIMVPPPEARRVDVKLRPAPEYPPAPEPGPMMDDEPSGTPEFDDR